MENNSSSPMNLTTRPFTVQNGNVLKELNNLEEVTKSPKHSYPINDVPSGNSEEESQQLIIPAPIADSAIVGPLDRGTTPTVPQAAEPDQIFSSRKLPNFSEMFPSINETTNKQMSDGLDTTAEAFNEPVTSLLDSEFCSERLTLTNQKPSDKTYRRRDTFNVTSPTVITETQEVSNSSESTSTFATINSTFVSDKNELLNQESVGNSLKKQDTFILSNSLCANQKSPLSKDQDDVQFKKPLIPGKTIGDGDINDNNMMVLKSADFDFLESRGANALGLEIEGRSSLLLRFDPLTGRAIQKSSVAVTQEQANKWDSSVPNETPSNGTMDNDANNHIKYVRIEKNGDKVICVDGMLMHNKKIDITSVDENTQKKMEEYEANQVDLLKRIAEKDKAIAKSSNVIELYEKAIAEALAAKEKLAQTYEKEHLELKADRDVTLEHLMSLETTFKDLHMKFDRNLQYIGSLQERVDNVTKEKSKASDSLHQQEQRYEKMKSHTKQQFDIANEKWDQQTRAFSLDNTKLKAQIKREEIHKNAVADELSQKKKENEELVKICDELISGQKN